MMSILKNIFFLSLLTIACNVQAQLTVSAVGGESAPGQTLEVDIVAGQFQDLSTFQFSVVWDSLVMTYVDITNIFDDQVALPDFSINRIGTPGSGSLKDGTVTTSWINPNGVNNLPANTRLFSIVLSAIGDECSTSTIVFENQEAGDANFLPAPVTTVDSEIKVSGADCGGGGGGGETNECLGSTDVVLSAPHLTAGNGDNVCFEVSVANFTNIEAVQTGLIWDTAVMTYTGVQNFGLPGLNANLFNTNDAGMGLIRQFWTEETGENPVSLQDGAVIYEVCFDVIGTDGQMTELTFGTIGTFGPEIVQSGASVDFCLDAGKLTVGEVQQPPFELIASDASAAQGSVVCLDVTSREFTMLRGVQFNMTWDNSVITYNRVENFNSTLGLTASNLNYSEPPVNLRFTWDNLTPQTLADNDRLFSVCFDVIGDCNTMPTTAVSFVGVNNSAIEIINADANLIAYELDNGSVSVSGCGHTCSFAGVEQADCPGGTGTINVTVDADADCQCRWTLDGTVIQNTPGNTNCNLANAAIGNYTFELTGPDGAILCTFTQEVTGPIAITTNPAVTNAGCGDSGMITLNASGGTGAISYSWMPNVSSSDVATDLAAGNYSIIITDANDCSITEDITITTELQDLAIDETSAVLTNPTCVGSTDGSFVPAATGGCPPYAFSFEGGGDGSGLAAGGYAYSITDSNGSEVNGSFMITDPAAITLTTSVVDANGGANGMITVTPTNGEGPFIYTWDPNVSSTNVASDLAAGNYSVTVTDDNGCSAISSEIPVVIVNPNEPPTFGPSTSVDVASCADDCTGTISSSIVNGIAPYTIDITGPSSSSMTLAAAGSFTFSDLCAGTYAMTVTDSNGASVTSESISVAEPVDLVASVLSVGADNNNCDGFIQVAVSGGTEPYTYEWSGTDQTGPMITNLCAGNYNLMVTDANGCMFMILENVPEPPADNCYVPKNIITPNDDTKNDFFTFTCINERPASLEIFDRYGRQVYSNASYDNSFNGISSDGVTLGQGGYMWVLNIDYGSLGREVMKGTLTILRD